MANHPQALQALVQFGTVVYFQNSRTPAQRELTYPTASVTNDCHHRIPTHVLLGPAAGLTEDELAHLGDDPLPDGVYAPDEAATVRYAQRSTRMDAIDDRTYGDLADHSTQQQLIEICFTVGLTASALALVLSDGVAAARVLEVRVGLGSSATRQGPPAPADRSRPATRRGRPTRHRSRPPDTLVRNPRVR